MVIHPYTTRDEAIAGSGDSKVAHEFVYWVKNEMTMEQWIALDDAMTEAFQKALGAEEADYVIGIAGPLPEVGINDPDPALD